jgi:hypothetical protein
MRFFTREKFDALQRYDPHVSDAEFDEWLSQTDWRAAARDYQDYSHAFLECASPVVARLVTLKLHDFKVLEFKGDGGRIQIVLGSPWQRPRFSSGYALYFEGVLLSHSQPTGEGVIVHEVIADGDQFIFCALLDKTELRIRFRQLTISDWSQ